VTQVERARHALYGQVRSIENDLASASGAIASVESRIASIEGSMAVLPSRLASVRGRGYAAMDHLEKSLELLSQKWAEVSPLVKQAFASNVQPMTGQIRAVREEVQRLRAEINRGSIASSHSFAIRLVTEASSLRSRTIAEAEKVASPLRAIESGIGPLDRDLKIAETTVALFSQAGFPLKPSESPVLAIEGKSMSGEKAEGTLYFTNQRFIFEAQKEVVLEKKLFIVTKKRTDRVVMIEQPIGALREITKGRVGLLAWTGIYIRFKPGVRVQETPFDVKGWEADVIGRFFTYIIGGEADADIARVRGVIQESVPTIRVARCAHCGAPYTREIYKGQTSVQCEYCGTSILIQ
jgi:DNA-directed RNA polymerase subunit RPC12/RpoP